MKPWVYWEHGPGLTRHLSAITADDEYLVEAWERMTYSGAGFNVPSASNIWYGSLGLHYYDATRTVYASR